MNSEIKKKHTHGAAATKKQENTDHEAEEMFRQSESRV